MPVTHSTKVFAVTDAKLYPLTTDVAGAAPTYGAAIDVPGIKSVAITGSVESKELRGDNTLLDSDSVITGVAVAIEYAKLSLDVKAALMGGTVADSGVTPNQTATWDLLPTSKPKPFKLEAISASADPIGGAVKFALAKVVLDSFPEFGLAEEDYKTHSVSGKAMPTLGTGTKWVTVTIMETAAALPA